MVMRNLWYTERKRMVADTHTHTHMGKPTKRLSEPFHRASLVKATEQTSKK